MNDLRFALRQGLKHPRFTAVAVLMLALCTDHDAMAAEPAAASAEDLTELIDIGGRKLRLLARGKGSLTVVIEAGLGESPIESGSWRAVLDAISQSNRVCIYAEDPELAIQGIRQAIEMIRQPTKALSSVGQLPASPSTKSFHGKSAGVESVVEGIRLCWCPPGTFRMGSPPDEPERRPDESRVEVTLTRGFWLGKYELTQGQWKDLSGRRGLPNRDGTHSRVRRGGAWMDPAGFCRSALRLRYEPERSSDHIGFRVAVVQTNPADPVH